MSIPTELLNGDECAFFLQRLTIFTHFLPFLFVGHFQILFALIFKHLFVSSARTCLLVNFTHHRESFTGPLSTPSAQNGNSSCECVVRGRGEVPRGPRHRLLCTFTGVHPFPFAVYLLHAEPVVVRYQRICWLGEFSAVWYKIPQGRGLSFISLTFIAVLYRDIYLIRWDETAHKLGKPISVANETKAPTTSC